MRPSNGSTFGDSAHGVLPRIRAHVPLHLFTHQKQQPQRGERLNEHQTAECPTSCSMHATELSGHDARQCSSNKKRYIER